MQFWGGGLSRRTVIHRHCEVGVRVRMSLAQPNCTTKCRSQQHADEVVAALTAGSEGQLRAFLTAHCYNAATLRDEFGRSALHMAASLGKRTLMEWLLESKGAEATVKDKESGWTAVHRSAFYGQIHCLISLVKVKGHGPQRLMPQTARGVRAQVSNGAQSSVIQTVQPLSRSIHVHYVTVIKNG